MAKVNEKFGLVLHYPTGAVTIGLFDTAQDALDYAYENPPPNRHDLADDSDVAERYQGSGVMVVDHGYEDNNAPEGYIIQKYVNGKPAGWAEVAPFYERDAVLHKEDKKSRVFDIDPEQKLSFD